MTAGRHRLGRRGRQALGAAILVLAFAPLYRLMDTSVEAPHRQVSVEVADITLQLAWWGTATVVLLSWLLARFLPTEPVRRLAGSSTTLLMKPPLWAYALMLGSLSAALAAITGVLLYEGYFTNVDEIASALHARYLARGLLAGPTRSLPEFWLIPNTLVVPEGWVSQFGPTHLALMALLIRAGAPTLVGPLSFGVMSAFVALSLVRMLPDRPVSARVAAVVVAVCPLLLFLAGGSMSHVSAGALAAVVLYLGLRARDGSAWWALPTGAAIGLLIANRPLVGIVLGSVFTLGVWVPQVRGAIRARSRWLAARFAATVAGGVPLAVLLGWYNDRLFASPFTLGYLAAFGDRHRLGFHLDPWGYDYGVAEAVAFTSSDMLAAGIQLLETPFPVTALIGLWLFLRARVPSGTGLLLSWAFLPVVANAFYWFHDVRMLYEAAPAWATLGVLAAVDLAGAGRGEAGGLSAAVAGGDRRHESDGSDGLARHGGRSLLGARAGDVFAWVTAIGVLGAVAWGVPERWGSYDWSQETRDRITAPAPPTDEPSIVFVHASWNERLSATLQGAGGMRQDTIVTVLRRNTNCALHRYALAREARAREGRRVDLPTIDLLQVPGAPVDIERPPAASGATARVRRGEPFPEACRRELLADRFGAVALAPLVWQGDLPGIERGHPLFVRDLGPAKNRRLLDHYPDRAAYVFTPTTVDGAPELLPYAEAMDLLWGAVQ